MFRPPNLRSRQLPADPLSASLEHEILGEKIATLARLTERLDRALAKLADSRQASVPDDTHHAERLAAAGEALWHVVIQRELCGLTDTERFLRDRQVPRAVRLRMGIAPAKP